MCVKRTWPFVWSYKERTCANMLVWRVLMLWLCVTSPGRNVCPLHLDTWQVSRRSQSRAQERGREESGWQWQQGPGPDSYYHSDYIYINFTTFYYFNCYLLLTLTHKRGRMQGSGEIMCLTATLILLMGRMIGGDHLISDHNNVFSSLSHVNFVSTLFLICQVFMVLVKLMWTWW